MYIEIRRSICEKLAQMQTQNCRLEMDTACSTSIEQSASIRLENVVRKILTYKLILNSILEDELFDRTWPVAAI